MKNLVIILAVIAVLAMFLAPAHAGGYGRPAMGNFGAAGGYGSNFSQVTTTYSQQQQVAPVFAAPMGYGAAGGCAPVFSAPVGYGSNFGAAGGCGQTFAAPVSYGSNFRSVNSYGSFGAGNGVTLGQVGGSGRGKFKQRSGIFGTRTVQKLR